MKRLLYRRGEYNSATFSLVGWETMVKQFSRIGTVTRVIVLSTTVFCCSTSWAQSGEPTLEDPTRAILAAFDKYEVVGMDAAHGNKDLLNPA
jgi:hypothetical protein